MRTEELLALGVFGRSSRLGDRIEVLLKHGRDFSPRASAARVLVSALVLLALVVAGSLAPRWIAFAQARPTFEVASVRPSKNPDAASTHLNPQGINYTLPLIMIIGEAYQVPYSRISSSVLDTRVMLRQEYDIAAKADRPVPREQLMLMLQTLLEDRFKLVMHHEARDSLVYRLVVGKNGPSLKESVAGGDPGMTQSAAGYAFRNQSMWRFAATLTGSMGRPVLDQTGLTGLYDFTFKIQLNRPDSVEDATSPDPEKAKMAAAAANDWSTSSVFSDIQKQLGLQLVSDRAPVDYLVVDHVEKPGEN